MTPESANGWAIIIGALFQGALLLYTARKARNADKNSSEAKVAATTAAAIAADKAQTADLKLDQIHEKADHAILQNEQIDNKVDGNLSKMWDVVNRLVDQVETLSKAATEKAVIVATESTERRVRATDKLPPKDATS